jgi:hypothetical protein
MLILQTSLRFQRTHAISPHVVMQLFSLCGSRINLEKAGQMNF